MGNSNHLHIQGGAKVGLHLRVHEFILVSLFINYCIIFHTDNCNPILAPPCIYSTNFLKYFTYLFLEKGRETLM